MKCLSDLYAGVVVSLNIGKGCKFSVDAVVVAAAASNIAVGDLIAVFLSLLLSLVIATADIPVDVVLVAAFVAVM